MQNSCSDCAQNSAQNVRKLLLRVCAYLLGTLLVCLLSLSALAHLRPLVKHLHRLGVGVLTPPQPRKGSREPGWSLPHCPLPRGQHIAPSMQSSVCACQSKKRGRGQGC